MTSQEAIKMLEYLATETTGNLAGENGEYAEFLVRVIDSLDMAIAALREQDATDINVGNKTNADHIRSMMDEELAETIVREFCAVSDNTIEFIVAKTRFRLWLKQPYEEDK